MGELTVNRRLAALLTCTTLILFSFQNCGRSGFETVDEADLLSSSLNGTNPTGKASAPIAFDIGLDSIAYNSCVPNKKGTSTYFTLKTTAGGTRGGVRLTSEFLTSAAGTLRPILGNPQVVDVQYKELIEQTNEGLEAQVALRSVTDFKAAYTGTAQGGIWGSFDFLTDDSWMTPVVESGRRGGNAFVPYSNRAPTSKSRLDFGFSQDFPATDYWSSLLNTQAFRSCAAQGCQGYGQFHIALGFSEPESRSLIRSPTAYTSAQTKAYGRAYQLQFGYPNNDPAMGMRVVKGVNEYNMATGAPIVEGAGATRWSCTEIPIMSSTQRGPADATQTSAIDNRFDDYEVGQIVTGANGLPIATDAFPKSYHYLCNPMSGALAAQAFGQMNLQKIREILPPSQWQLGFQNTTTGSRLCVIPVGMDCYPNEAFPNYQVNGAQQPFPYFVTYQPGQRCINEDNMATELTRVDAGAIDTVCSHYVTVCTKL
jgi:hypothetical protein